ncbi:MAG: hypothetical protein GYA24_08645, partial [Candidatus Lokiarchaeota archaeon]|nr:hypothetical protein [Candidatus Lokiarchaeota archaeon]
NFKLGKSIHFKVAEPITVKANIKKEDRHALAAQIVDKILAMKKENAEIKDEESSSAPKKP